MNLLHPTLPMQRGLALLFTYFIILTTSFSQTCDEPVDYGDCGIYFEVCNDDVTTAYNTAIDISVTANDDLTELPSPCGFTISSQPTHGDIQKNGCEVEYTPDLNYEGIDFFSYKYSYIAQGCDCITIDFNSFATGTVMNNQYGSDVTISAQNGNASHPDKAIIFNSSIPTGGDVDLGTPNQDFGGPGIGAGGKSGQPGQNNQSLGKLLIIAENDTDTSPANGLVDNPDDEAGGGFLIFEFGEAVKIQDLKIIDLEEGENYIRTYDANDVLMTEYQLSGFGDNSLQTQVINEFGVSKLVIDFASSGAIDDLHYCKDVVQTAEATVAVLVGGPGSLPIDFGHITGRAQSKTNYISWEILDVEGEKKLNLQKSVDGLNFKNIKTYTDLKTGTFSGLDEKVDAQITYYRLESTSFNGDITLSRTISVTNENISTKGVSIFPMPASTDMQFNANQVITKIEIFDLAGKKIISENFDSSNAKMYLNAEIKSGIYIARINFENGLTEIKKININR